MHQEHHNGLQHSDAVDMPPKMEHVEIGTDTMDDNESVLDALERAMFERAR